LRFFEESGEMFGSTLRFPANISAPLDKPSIFLQQFAAKSFNVKIL